jgi:hypothetical protein
MVGVLSASVCGPACGQFQKGEPGGAKLGEAKVQQWRCGLTVEAVGGACKGIVGYVPFPAEWPEQDVRIVAEDISREAKVSYETIDETVKLMVVKIANLGAGQEAHALVTFEVRRSVLLPPEKTDVFHLPDPKKLDRKLRTYLAPSREMLIDPRDPKIRAAAKEVGADKEKAWEHVEAIYDWVREKVQYKPKDRAFKGPLAALKDGTGDCEEMTSLFIAVCRAAGIPARMVWIPSHCYPEFYLVDGDDQGHWFPCQAAGDRAFGGIPEQRLILQKGDSFRAPWDRREHRYLPEHVAGLRTPGSGEPRVKFVRELAPQ